MTFDPIGGNVENEDIPNVDLSEQRVYKMLRDIKRNAVSYTHLRAHET